MTRKENGVIAVDINSDHLAVVETDRFGNPLHTFNIPLPLHQYLQRPGPEPSLAMPQPKLLPFAKRHKNPSFLKTSTLRKRKPNLGKKTPPILVCSLLLPTHRSLLTLKAEGNQKESKSIASIQPLPRSSDESSLQNVMD